jgi:hypothetical protein
MTRCKLIVLAAAAALALPMSARAEWLIRHGCTNCGTGGSGGSAASGGVVKSGDGVYGGFGKGGFGVDGGFGGKFGGHPCPKTAGGRNGKGLGLGLGFFQPPFQAAPWYLYYPYDQHFQMPAPIGAPYFAPQAFANPAMNTYFPPPAYGVPPTPAVGPVTPIPAVK